MPFTIDSELIENNHVQLSTDANGNAALVNKVTGETLTLDDNLKVSEILSAEGGGTSELRDYASIEAERGRFADVGVTRNAREYLLQNGFSNIAPAINALIAEVLAEQIGGGKITIPHPRTGDPGTIGNDWLLSEPISVPYHSAREVRISLVGAGMGGVTLRPDFATPGPAIQKQAAPGAVTGSSVDAGFAVRGLSIRDLNGVATKIVDANDTYHVTIKDCTLQGSTATTEVIHLHGPNAGAFFGLVDNCRITKSDGTTGIRLGDDSETLGANASTVRHCELTGAIGTSVGIDIDFAGSSNIIGGNTDNAGTAIRITKNGVGVFGHRFEAPYGETNANSNVITPIEIIGAEGCYINPNIRHGIYNTASPNDPPRDFVRASKWGGQYNTFDMGVVTRHGVDHGGGSTANHWLYDDTGGNSAPTRDLGHVKLTTPATSGQTSRYFAQNFAEGDQLSRLDVSANLAHTAGHVTVIGWQNDINNRAVFIADPGNTLGTGITANWIAQTLQGGTSIGETNTGVSINADQRVFSIVPEKVSSPFRWRYIMDGTTVATHEDATLSGDIGYAGPNLQIETRENASKTLRVLSIVPRILGSRGKQKL